VKKATKDYYNIPITEEQLNGGAEWVKAHKGTDIVDTPLWVLISLGVKAITAESEDKA
jgi:hypothetical protein